MDKDFKKIFIMGVVSIIISALSLYSFRDIKFKDTKQLAKKNAQEQQKLLEEYNKTIIDYDNIYIPDITDSEKNHLQNTTGTLSILIPGFLDNTGFKYLSTQLKTEKNINLDINTTDLGSYRKLVQSGFGGYDIYLIPSDRAKGLDLESIDIGENPKPYFISIFDDIVDTDDNKYIPYSLDPAITIYKSTINPINSRDELFSFGILREENRKYTMPLIWGLGEAETKLLEKGLDPFENYFTILFLHLKQIKESGKIGELLKLLNTKNLDLNYKYSYNTLKNIKELISNKNPYCEKYPSICAISYNFGDIKFGFLSDFDILDRYFSKQKNNFIIDKFINSDISYPVRGWLFVVPKGNQNISLANQFFQSFLVESIQGYSGFWDKTLSSVNIIYDTQKTAQFFKPITQYENKYRLFFENITLQEKFVQDGKSLNMLNGNYDPSLYLENFNY